MPRFIWTESPIFPHRRIIFIKLNYVPPRGKEDTKEKHNIFGTGYFLRNFQFCKMCVKFSKKDSIPLLVTSALYLCDFHGQFDKMVTGKISECDCEKGNGPQ